MKIICILISFAICINISTAQKRTAENQKSISIEKVINSQWTFNYFPSANAGKGYESAGFDDSKWPAISIPHTWNSFETTGKLQPEISDGDDYDNTYWWSGWGWYRKHFSIFREYSDRKVLIEFGGVREYCKVWLNGKYLGDHKGDSGSFVFEITGYLKPGEDNLLAVAVNNNQKGLISMHAGKSGRINLYSGICHDVTLILKNKLNIVKQESAGKEYSSVVSKSQVADKEGAVRIQTLVKNDFLQKKNCVLQTSISDYSGKVLQVIKTEASINPGELYKFDQLSKSQRNPKLWSMDGSFTGRVFTEVIEGKVVIDNAALNSELITASVSDSSDIFIIDRILEGLTGNLGGQTFEKNISFVLPVNLVEPVSIRVTCSEKKIISDRGSEAIVTAGLIDSKGNLIESPTKTINWQVTGPAKLAGPSVYESEINRHHQTEGFYYRKMPVSNIIRSTGRAGKIQVVVSVSGLASGVVDIESEPVKYDKSVITEPTLEDQGRTSVVRNILKSNRIEDIPREIRFTSEEFRINPLDKAGFKRQIRDYIMKNNSVSDSSSVEFRTLTDLLAIHLQNNNGQLSSYDYNLNIDHYNNCRLIAGYIGSTKLPQPFKEGLRQYYAYSVITNGSQKDAGEEMNWLNWIPSGGTVVIYREGGTGPVIKGVMITPKNDLAGMIELVYPVFSNFSVEAKDRALIFISKMNPYIRIVRNNQEDKNVVNEKKMYIADKDQFILIPLLKFISE
jgi:hypothetical protein